MDIKTLYKLNTMEDKIIYFQPHGIKPQYCEAGIISAVGDFYHCTNLKAQNYE